MAFSQLFVLSLFASFLLMQTPGDAATCSDCFTRSRAAYYPNSDEKGTESESSNCIKTYYKLIRSFVSITWPLLTSKPYWSWLNCSWEMWFWNIWSNNKWWGCSSCIWSLSWWHRLWCLLPGDVSNYFEPEKKEKRTWDWNLKIY